MHFGNILGMHNKNEERGVAVVLSLCLTEHHAMKTYWGVEV